MHTEQPRIRNDIKHIPYWINWLLGAIAFSFPFGRRITSPLLIALFVTFFLYLILYRRKTLFRPLRESRQMLYIALPASYYALCIIGLLYTSNLSEGIFELDKKITLLALPVFFILYRAELTTKTIANVLKSFVVGMIVCGLISIALGFYYSINRINGQLIFRTAVNDTAYERGDSFLEQVTQGGNYFFGSYISPFIPTNYYGLYLSLGCVLGFSFFVPCRRNYGYLAAGLFLFFILILTDARGPLISLLLSIPVVILLGKKSKAWKKTLPLLIIAIISIVWISPRTSLLIEDFDKTVANVDYNSRESTELRLVVWSSAIEIIRKNWLIGVGTGDREDAMLAVTRHRNKAAFEWKLNAHNQYLEAFITFGVFGLVTLLFIILAPLRRTLSRGNVIFTFFLLTLGLNMLFESVLQVFQGIVFFSLFYCLFTLHSFKHHETTTPR